MLEIILLRLRGALILCMELQRAPELHIGRAWDKCAPEAFDLVATAARKPVARLRLPSRRGEARRRRLLLAVQSCAAPLTLHGRVSRATDRRDGRAGARR